MKILFVTNMFPSQRTDISYYGIFVKEQMDALNSHTPAICDYFIIDGFRSKLNYLTSIPRVLKAISDGSYDVIHVHYGLSGIFLLSRPFKKWPNVILTFHGTDILIKQKKYVQVLLSKIIARKASRLIVLNEEMLQVAQKSSTPTCIIPCGVDEVFFSGKKKPLGICTLLFAGDPSRWVKNYPLFEKIIESYANIYGEVTVRTLGNLDREGVKSALLSCSALIMCSHSEGSPQIIKEALSCDIPIISSNVGDVAYTLGKTLGTRIFELHEETDTIAKLVRNAIDEASAAPGARRQRLLELKLDNTSIAKRIYSEYLELKNKL